MDAAQTFRKTALFLAIALLCAGSAFAAGNLTTNLGSNPTVNIQSLGGASTTFNLLSDNQSATNFTVTVPATAWYSVSPLSGSTSGTAGATITVVRDRASIIGTGCGATCPDSQFTITGPNNTQTITMHDSGSTGGGGSTIISSNPAPSAGLLISASNGGSNTGQIVISTSSATAVQVTASVNPSTWLSILPASNPVSSGSPVTFYVFANSSLLSPDTTYTGSATFTASGNSLTVPVTFKVGSGSTVTAAMTASPNSVSLGYPSGNSSANVTVTSTTASSFFAQSNATWLFVNNAYSTVGTIGTSVQLSVYNLAAAGLGSGTYNGTVSIYDPNNTSNFTQVNVTLTVGSGSGSGGGGGSTGFSVGPTNLTYYYQIGKQSPPCQTVAVTGNDTFQITYSQGSRFFPSVPSLTTTGAGTFQICPTVFAASAGTSSATISVTNSSNQVQNIQATLFVSDATPVLAATVNGSVGDIVCASQSGCTVPVSVSTSDGSVVGITATASNSWITLSSSPTTTPASFNVTLNATGLSGLNTGSITITPTSGAANATLVIPVALALAGTTNTSGLTVSSSSLNFTSAGTQNLTVSAGSITTIQASVPSSGCSWLSISPSGTLTTSNTTIAVTATNTGVTIGQTYTCNISLQTSGGTTTVPVTFTPGGSSSGGNVTLSTTTLNFSTQQGVSPATQTIQVTGQSATTVAFSVSTAVTTTTQWLSVSKTSGTTPDSVVVSVNPGSLQPGTYIGYVYITGASAPVQVNLTITTASVVSATPTSLTFNYEAGSATPAAQQISVTGAQAGLPFSATVTSGSDWLSVSPATGTTGAAATTVSVSVNPQNLQANKSYTGTIVVAGTGSATGSTTINVTINVSAPLPTVTRVTNAASFNTGQIAAGEIITIFGTAIGPSTLTVASPTNGVFPTQLGGVQVTVGGVLCPIIYVRNDQVSVQVPYEINRPVFIANPALIVRFLGQSSNGVNLQQAAAAPGIFTVGGGTGQGAILNSNLSVNSHANPATRGDVIVLYVTGEGQTSPLGATGKITSAPYPTPISGQVTVTIGGQPAQVQFAGEAPGLISGVMQVNVVVPSSLNITGPTDAAVVVSVGGTHSQTDAQGNGAVSVALR